MREVTHGSISIFIIVIPLGSRCLLSAALTENKSNYLKPLLLLES